MVKSQQDASYIKHPVECLRFSSDTWTKSINYCNIQTLSVQIIVFPEGSQLVFAADVPDGELQVLIFNRLHVEALERQENKQRLGERVREITSRVRR